MIQAYNTFLTLRGDFIFALLAVVVSCLVLQRYLRTQREGSCIPCRYFATALLLMLLGGGVAEWAGRERMRSMQKVFEGFAPTYAAELSQHGHHTITLTTSPDDPHYLELIGHQKTWLAANPIIADVYTFRADAEGKIRFIVDSETDYDHSGAIDDEREGRTAIGEIYAEATPAFFEALEGRMGFDTAIMADRWGVWLSSFAPIRGPNGKVEAGVGIDFPAQIWLSTLGSIRALVLGLTLVLVAILLVSAAFIARLRVEIEERKETQRRLEQASESAFAASAAKSEFLAVMSHEVRTPLSAIMGFANLLADTELNPRQRRHLDTINRAGAGLVELLNGILDYTKIEGEGQRLERMAWAPALLIHEAMELMTARAEEKKLQLNFDNQLPGTLTLFGDPIRVRQIILNLLSNALKFTEAGSVTVRAGWQAEAGRNDHGRLTVEVTDTGIGIAPEKVPLLFQAFGQASAATTRQQGGTGLGLAICKRLADLMGAKLSVRSALQAGSTFVVELSADAADACGLGYRAPGEAAPALAVWNRALVIDDTKMNRELLKVMLRRLGLETDLASGGAEAVRLATANRYAIIFSDLEMPELDGFETARRIRREANANRQTPIVAVSAMTAAGTREKCVAAGMDDYLTKPVYLPALKSVLEAQIPSFKGQAAPKAQVASAAA